MTKPFDQLGAGRPAPAASPRPADRLWTYGARAVADVNDAVRAGLDSDAVLGLVARRVRMVLSASASAVLTLETVDHLLVRAVDGDLPGDLQGAWVPVADTLEGAAVRRQQPFRSDDPDAARWRCGTRQTGAATGSLGGDGAGHVVLVVPVPGYDRPGGVVLVADRPGRRFTEADAWAVELFAASVGMEVEHDRACAGLERLAITTTPGTTPLQQTLDTLTSSVVAGTGALACAVHLPDDDLTLRRVSSHDPAGVLDAGVSAVEPHVAQAAMAARAPIVHDDLGAASPRVGGNTTRAVGPPPRTGLVCVPLLSRGLVLGVLCGHWPAGSHPSTFEMAYLSVVAGKAASAVDSAQLVTAAQEKAALEERQRLARELHDSVSQALYGIALGARTAREGLVDAPEHVDQPIRYILSLAEAGLADMRALIFELRPQALAEEGLVAALEKQLAALQARHGVSTLAELGQEPPGALTVKQALYRVAQEALQNIARHAQARQVTLRLASSATALSLEIVDDGVGFDPTASFPGHLGLRSMRERVTEIGGVLDLTSAPGQGTRIHVRAPSGV